MTVQAEIAGLQLATELSFGRSRTESRDAQIVRLYDREGWNLRETAFAADCCIETVRNVLRRHGLKTRPWGKNRQ